MHARRTLLLALVVPALLIGCGAEVEFTTDEPSDEFADESSDEFTDGPAGGSGFGLLDGGDPAELAEAVADEPCDPTLIVEDHGPVEAIYLLVEGRLAGLCFGDPSPTLVDSWISLAAVAPPEQLEPVVLLAGFASTDDTVAFAGAADQEQYEQFLIAVDLVSAEERPDETRLTMVHELAHVFTQTPDQLDITADPDLCDTFWNGAGCFFPDSYVARWVSDFWTEDDLAAQPADGSADTDLGLERCELDPAFLGAYAASSPEEDLAESFSGFVFDLDVPASVQPKLDWFAQFPELAVFRDLQRVSGLPPAPNTFDVCG